MTDENEELTKIRVDLPNQWATGGESLWAQKLGDDLYELRSVPFHAYGLSFLDVVRAVSRGPQLKPEVREVVRKSGHRTLRVFFNDDLEETAQDSLLASLPGTEVSYERADKRFAAVDVPLESDYQAVCDQLWQWEQDGLLEYETCEARVADSFDDTPMGRR